jgi:hypothetical protein
MKKTFFIILLVIFFLGCTLPLQNNGNGGSVANATYKAIGINSFYSDAPDISSGGISNVKLAVTNYGPTTATNIYAKLLGHEGQDITIEGEYISIEQLAPSGSTEFFWPMEMPSLSVDTDIIYIFDARVYYDYGTNASKEVVFMSGVEAPIVTPHSSSTEAPVSVSLTSLEPIRMNPDDEETEFTVTVRIQNVGQGYVGYIDADGNEMVNKDNYLDRVNITVPTSWRPLHADDPELWTIYYNADETIMSMNYPQHQDTRMRLVRGDHTTYSIGFVRSNVGVETVESIKVMAYYSYYIPTKSSVDITVRGQQQTY